MAADVGWDETVGERETASEKHFKFVIACELQPETESSLLQPKLSLLMGLPLSAAHGEEVGRTLTDVLSTVAIGSWNLHNDSIFSITQISKFPSSSSSITNHATPIPAPSITNSSAMAKAKKVEKRVKYSKKRRMKYREQQAVLAALARAAAAEKGTAQPTGAQQEGPAMTLPIRQPASTQTVPVAGAAGKVRHDDATWIFVFFNILPPCSHRLTSDRFQDQVDQRDDAVPQQIGSLQPDGAPIATLREQIRVLEEKLEDVQRMINAWKRKSFETSI